MSRFLLYSLASKQDSDTIFNTIYFSFFLRKLDPLTLASELHDVTVDLRYVFILISWKSH